jgi:hypothetical protein
MGIEQSTHYDWVRRAEQPCDRDQVDLGLLSNIHEIWTRCGCTYGSDRVWRQLRRDGICVGRKRIERLMRGQGWQGAFLRRAWRKNSTTQDPRAAPAPDLLENDDTASGNRRSHFTRFASPAPASSAPPTSASAGGVPHADTAARSR